MAPITVSVDVEQPAQDVFAYATDPSRFHEWQQGVLDGRMDEPVPLAVGAHCVTTRRIGFADRPSTSEVVRIDPPRAWSVRGMDGPIRAAEPFTATRARLTITVDFVGHGIGKALVPLVVRPQARKEMPQNLAKLKGHLESRAHR